MDTVPSNSPGKPTDRSLDREYGHDPATVASHATAVLDGFAAAGLAATAKHFPGLGRVTGNTDTTSGVTDTLTTRLDPYLTPFADAVDDERAVRDDVDRDLHQARPEPPGGVLVHDHRRTAPRPAGLSGHRDQR